MLEKMKSIKEGESTLLENSMILFGSPIRDGNSHNPHNLPLVMAGQGGGTLKTGRHLMYPKNTPACNLYKSMLQRMGTPVERFADSPAQLAGSGDENYSAPKG